MITYTEKGIGLHDAIHAAGHSLKHANGVWVSSDDTAVQAIIDSYDPIIKARADKITELKAEGLRRANLVYGDEVFVSVGAIKLLMDIDDTYTRPGAPAARLVSVNQVITMFNTKKAVINAATLAEVESYDVTAGW